MSSFVNLLDVIYPIGSIYMSMDDGANPASTVGGTWTQVTGKFLYANSEAQKSGGSETHQHDFGVWLGLTYSAPCGLMQADDDIFGALQYSEPGVWAYKNSSLGKTEKGIYPNSGTQLGRTYMSGSTRDKRYSIGSTNFYSSLPPYITCKMWYRTA